MQTPHTCRPLPMYSRPLRWPNRWGTASACRAIGCHRRGHLFSSSFVQPRRRRPEPRSNVRSETLVFTNEGVVDCLFERGRQPRKPPDVRGQLGPSPRARRALGQYVQLIVCSATAPPTAVVQDSPYAAPRARGRPVASAEFIEKRLLPFEVGAGLPCAFSPESPPRKPAAWARSGVERLAASARSARRRL